MGVGRGVEWVVVAKQRPLIKTGIWFLCVRCRLLKTAAAVIEDARPTPTPTPTYPHPTVPCPYSPLPSPPLSPPLIYLYRDDGSDTCSLVARFFMAPKRVPGPYRPYAYDLCPSEHSLLCHNPYFAIALWMTPVPERTMNRSLRSYLGSYCILESYLDRS